jgi:DNA gyrase subunit A
MALRSGRAIRFNESTVRPMGRTATGVRGITLGGPKDEVIGMIAVNDPDTTILVVSEKGYGKRSDIEDYRVTNRGGKGVKTIQITDKTGDLIGLKDVNETDHLMIINKSGLTIRMAVTDLRVMGRATQGVRLIKLNDDDQIASIAKIEDVKEDELAVELDENGNPIIVETDIETTSSDESEDVDNKDDNTTNIEE